jgi:serine/threonine protein kinase
LASHPHVLVCTACQSQNQETAETCFKCGQSLFVVTQGALLAGRYEILEPLGKGGMGMVYKARDRELDEIVALKVLRPEIARSGDMARRFRSEIKLARKIRHRNVCGIHEFGQDGHLQFIAMELIQGVDFKKVLKERGTLPLAEAYDVTIQIAKGLQAIHDAGIVHRDLKTPNLMRDSQGIVRLMDFGIAKDVAAAGGETVTGQIVGTPEYMSPEQARGQRVDQRSDIYALGVVVWELFTGDVPFRGDSPLATLYKQIQDPLPLQGPLGSALPGPLKPVLEKALAKEPQDRYQSVREFAEAVRSARTASGVTGSSGKVPVVRAGSTDPTTIVPPEAEAATLRPDLDDDDFGSEPPTVEPPAPTVAMPSPSLPTPPVRPRKGGVPIAGAPPQTVLLERNRPPRAGTLPSRAARRALVGAGVVAAIAIVVVIWETVRPGDEEVAVSPGRPPIVTAAPPVTVASAAPSTIPNVSPTAPSGTGVGTPGESPMPAKPLAPSPRGTSGRVADGGTTGPPVTLAPRRTATAPPVTLPPRPAVTPAPATPPPATPPPATTPPVTLAPPPTAATPPALPPSSGGPPPWNSVPAVRQALNAYVAAFVSLDPNAIRAVYPGISKSELERIRYFKAYDMEVEPGRIEISGKQARVEVSLKAAIKAFTGKEHLLAPHQEVFVLEYKDGAWVRVK